MDFVVVAIAAGVSAHVLYPILLPVWPQNSLSLSTLLWLSAHGVYHVGFWSRLGATPAQMLVGQRLVDADTYGPLGERQALVRWAMGWLALLPLGAGFWFASREPRFRSLADWVATTVVVGAPPLSSQREPQLLRR